MFFFFQSNRRKILQSGKPFHIEKLRTKILFCYASKVRPKISGALQHTDKRIVFEKGEMEHEARRGELWSSNSHKSVILLTNNFELDVRDIKEIYKRRWAIEPL